MMEKVFLKELAFARSGDKGDVSNVGVMAKSKSIYNFLRYTTHNIIIPNITPVHPTH